MHTGEGNYGNRPKMAKLKNTNRPVVSRRPLSRCTRPPARPKRKTKVLVVMEPKPLQVRQPEGIDGCFQPYEAQF